MSRHWFALPAVESETADRLLVLPLREPLTQPTIMRGSGAVIWALLVERGEAGADAAWLADAFTENGTDHEQRRTMIASIVAFLEELADLGLARSDEP